MNAKVTRVVQIVFGLIFAIFGLNKLVPFMAGGEIPQRALDFFMALAATGYFLPVLGIVEIALGLMLLFRYHSAFAVLMSSVITVNILLFHIFLAPSGLLVALILLAMNVYLLIAYKDAYFAMCNCDCCCSTKPKVGKSAPVMAASVASAAPAKESVKAPVTKAPAKKKAAKKR